MHFYLSFVFFPHFDKPFSLDCWVRCLPTPLTWWIFTFVLRSNPNFAERDGCHFSNIFENYHHPSSLRSQGFPLPQKLPLKVKFFSLIRRTTCGSFCAINPSLWLGLCWQDWFGFKGVFVSSHKSQPKKKKKKRKCLVISTILRHYTCMITTKFIMQCILVRENLAFCVFNPDEGQWTMRQ